jgi:two-component system sensor histidine kinase YesM
MVETINDLIERKFRLELENKSTQLKVLQSQINPHFLYNAFQSIGTLALKHKAVEVYSLLTSLSHIMRYSMNMKEDIVSLKQEVDHVKAFLSLQKQRFGSKFEYELNIEKEAELMRIPKMILQPLVENSFKHGFETRTGSGKLFISAELNGEELILTVSDNGKGIGEQELNQLKTRLQQSYNQTDEHIGLQNIYERLRIYYGDHASMQISSQENHDFTVVIKLTTIEEKRDSDESINRG